MLAPHRKQVADLLPIFLEAEVFSNQIGNHEHRAGSGSYHLDNLVVRIVRRYVVSLKAPSELEKADVGVTVQGFFAVV